MKLILIPLLALCAGCSTLERGLEASSWYANKQIKWFELKEKIELAKEQIEASNI
jgi:hypothetical protein